MFKIYYLLCIGCLSFFCLPSMAQEKQTPKSATQFPTSAQFANTKLTYKIIPAANHTFCYDVLANDKILIHQPSKPGLTGNEVFATKNFAEKYQPSSSLI